MLMKHKYTIKQILTHNQAWWNFYKKYEHRLRDAIPKTIVKVLSCKHIVRGYKLYNCSDVNCSHSKKVPFTCKSKGCSSCGKKATDNWIQKQKEVLPNTSWQHITFTMPNVLWDFFWHNRQLLNVIGKIAADCIMNISNKKNVIPGVFIAIHTFGRDLKRNVHIHLSTTLGGLTKDGSQWKKLFFNQSTLMRMWRYNIITLFRNEYNKQSLNIPNKIQRQLNHTFTFNNLLDKLYSKTWIVHCSKPSKNYKQNVNYLGRYVKRPPIAQSKIKHYDGISVSFRYLDHNNNNYRNFRMSVEQFIASFIQHIPDIGFRMIRYYGFLSNRLRGKMLPDVYKLLNQEVKEQTTSVSYVQLMIQNFQTNPLKCTLCGKDMLLTTIKFGITNIQKLLGYHYQLALMKKI